MFVFFFKREQESEGSLQSCQKLGILQLKSSAEEVEILFTVEFILFYNLHERYNTVIL